MKKRTFNRCLSVLLTLVMVFGLLPMTVFAEDTPDPMPLEGWQIGDEESNGVLYVKEGDATPVSDPDDDGETDDFAIQTNPVHLKMDVEDVASGLWYLEDVELEYSVNGVPAAEDLEYVGDDIAGFAAISPDADNAEAAVSFTGTIPENVWEALRAQYPGSVIEITDVEIEAEYQLDGQDWDVELHDPTGWTDDNRDDLDYTVEIYLDGELADSFTGACKPETEITISPEEIDGYVFDYSDPADLTRIITENGEVFKLYYLSDTKGGGVDGRDKDGIADEYEAFVYYETDGNGTATPAFEVHDLRLEDGSLKTEVVLDGSLAEPNTDYTFENWTGDGMPEGAGAAANLEGTLTNVVGNATYVFTANFEAVTEPITDDPEDPKILVYKEANVDEAKIGDTITYTVKVKNDGTETVDARVVETLDGAVFENDAEEIVLEDLVPNEERTLTVTYVVKAADLVEDDDGKEVENIVTVFVGEHSFEDEEDVDIIEEKDDWTDGDPDQKDDDDKTGDGTPDSQQAKAVYKVAEGQEAMGDVALAKTGAAEADEVYEIATAVATGWNKVHGGTAKAAEGYELVKWTLDGEDFEMNPANVAAKLQAGAVITFVAHFKASEPAPVPVAAMEVTKTSEQTGVRVGELITWTVTVKNTGDLELKEIVVKEKLAGAVFKDLPDGAAVNTDGTVTIPALAVDASAALTVTYTPTEAGTVKNTVVAASGTLEKEAESELIPVDPALTAAMEVTKTSKQTSVTVGEPIIWTVTVTNTGTAELKEIVVKEELAGAAFKDLPDGAAVNTDGTVTIPALAVDASAALTVTYTPTEAGTVKNTVVATSGTVEEDAEAPEVEVVEKDAPAVNIIKQPCAINGRLPRAFYDVEAGDTVTWQITVQNVGNVKLVDLIVGDTLEIDDEMIKLKLFDEDGRIVKSFDLEVGAEKILFAEYEVTVYDEGEVLHNWVKVYERDNPKVSDVDDDKSFWVDDDRLPVLNKDDHIAYIIGYEDYTVRPENSITRAEVATIFFRLLDDDSRAYYWCKTNSFKDVARDDWYNNAISTMSRARIITGYPDGTFRPNDPITRAEFAAVAARFSDVIYDGDSRFSDVLPGFWANDEIVLAEYLGWINGYPDGSFRPNRNITRAEAMTLVNRVLERAVEHDHMLRHMIHWVDNPVSAWYYEAVQEATNSHTYVRLNQRVPGQDFNFEDWENLIENPDWEALEKTWSDANDQ